MRIKNLENLTSHGNVEGRKLIAEIMEAGLQASDPYYNTLKLLHIEDGKLHIGYPDFEPTGSPRTGEDVYDLSKDIDRIFVFGAGKGVQRVVKALEEILGDYLVGGQVVVKYGDELILDKVQVAWGGHPLPDEGCVEGCKRIIASIEAAHLTERDLVFTVAGNGISSLLTLPVPEVSLPEVMEMVRITQIVRGLPTSKVSIIRNQLDQLKGGRITRLLRPAKMIHIQAIDINEVNSFGDRGYRAMTQSNMWLHFLPDMSSAEDAIKILKDSDSWDLVSESIRKYLSQPHPERDVLRKEEFEQMDCRIYGIMPTHMNFVPVAMQKAEELGYPAHLLTRKTFVEASVAGALVGRIATTVENYETPFKAPCALVLTGELVVTVGKEGGIGGRNQEFALAASTVLFGSKRIVIATADTDGTDGPGGRFDEDAWNQGCHTLTGGIVDGYLLEEAKERGVDVQDALKTHATSKALWQLDSGIWATQNISVQDLIVVLIMDHDGATS